MNNNFWSRSRSMKGLNHLVDDAFLKIDENNKKEDEPSGNCCHYIGIFN